jgi:hypothetical protein
LTGSKVKKISTTKTIYMVQMNIDKKIATKQQPSVMLERTQRTQSFSKCKPACDNILKYKDFFKKYVTKKIIQIHNRPDVFLS